MNKIGKIDERLIKNNLINLKQIVFEVTEKCNLNCKYCGLSDLYQQPGLRKNQDLSFKNAQLMIDYLVELWKDNHIPDVVNQVFVSFYGGEPLIKMDLIKEIIDYIECLKIVGKKFIYSMTTNAMLLDKHMDYLVEKKFKLLISLDGDETAQSYRLDHSGNNSFKQVFQNVKLLQNKHPVYFNELVRFASVLHNRNEVESIYNFFKTNFDVVTKINLLRTDGIRVEKKEEFRKMYKNKMKSIDNSQNCEEIEEENFIDTPNGYKLTQYLYYLSGNIFFDNNQLLFNNIAVNEIFTGTCTPFSKKMFLTAAGKIIPCERIDHNFGVGFVHDNYVELDYKYVAERHNYYISKCAKQCLCCSKNKQCLQCVYQIDNLRNESSHCHSFYTKEKFDNENKEIFDYLCQHPHYYNKVLNEISIGQ